MCNPGDDVHSIVIHTHLEWGCASPGMHILTRNGDVPHRKCTSSPGMEMCLTENGDHRKWGCASPGIHILTGNAYPHQQCT